MTLMLWIVFIILEIQLIAIAQIAVKERLDLWRSVKQLYEHVNFILVIFDSYVREEEDSD